jgi:hypothetical protein
MNCTHNHSLTTTPPTRGPCGCVRVIDTCSRCGSTRSRDTEPTGRVHVGRWQPRTMREAQREALGLLVSRTVESGEGVSLATARALAARGLAVVNEFRGRFDDAKRITHWNARITDEGKAALAKRR